MASGDDRVIEALATIDEALASQVVYEYRMQKWAAVMATSFDQGSPQSIVSLEAFGVHYRNLLDFFEPSGRVFDTDVTAKRFMDDNLKVGETGLWRQKLHRWLSHISTDRLDVFRGRRAEWPVGQMALEMEALWRRFFDELGDAAPEKVAWFADPVIRDDLPPDIDLPWRQEDPS